MTISMGNRTFPPPGLCFGGATPPPEPLPLDGLDVLAAYSIARKLRTDYDGAALRVRRSSDNSEQDIGFTGANVTDEAAMLDFVGVGDGFLTGVFDHSGNGLNLSQPTAALQPKIVSGGGVERMNAQAAGRFESPSWLTFEGSMPPVTNVQALTVGEFEAGPIPVRFARMVVFLSPSGGGSDFNNPYSFMLSRKGSDGVFYGYLNNQEVNAGPAPGSGPHLAQVRVSTTGITVGVDGAEGIPAVTAGILNTWNKIIWGGNESLVPGDGVTGFLGELAVFPNFLSVEAFAAYRADAQAFWGTP